MKTSELTGAALDWAVSKTEQPGYENWRTAEHIRQGFKPSTNWAQGGPIIEREGIAIGAHMDKEEWIASDYWNQIQVAGETPLIAAMRCYVASKLGDDVEIPEELMEQA